MDKLPKNCTQQEISLSLLLCLFIFSCARSSLLRGLSLAAVNGGYSLVMVHGFLIAVASSVADQGL